MKNTRLIQIIREEIEKVMNEDQLDEMATFYKVKGDPEAAKSAIAKAKEKYKEGTALYNTLDTLEKSGEIDYKALAKETGKDVATYNNPKSRGVLEKDLAAFIDPIKLKKAKKASAGSSKKSSTGKKKKSSPSSVSKLEKKYTVDVDGEGPTNAELRNLAKSGESDDQLNQLQNQEKKKLVTAFKKDMQSKGIVDKANKILDTIKYKEEWAKAKPEIVAKAKAIR